MKDYSQYKYHGGPFDRGACDSYYRRPPSPHKFPQGLMGQRVELTDPEEIAAYWAGFDENEAAHDFKDWGRE
jgi:hypothetical protein